MRIEVIGAHELEAQDRRLWSRFAEEAGLVSPFLSPGWLDGLHQAGGPDAHRNRVAVLEGEDGERGFLPVRWGRLISRPAGAPLCDYQALLASPGFEPDLRAALAALRTGRLDFTAAPSSLASFQPHASGAVQSHVIDLRAGWSAYEADRELAGSQVLKEAAKKRRKLERELGEVVFTPSSADPSDFEQLIAWKRRQYRLTGQTDVFAFGWPRRLLETLMSGGGEGCRAELHTLRAGGRLVAAHLALRSRQALHAWFIAHDEEARRCSPGLLLIVEVARWAAEEGLKEVDLGAGDYPFKTRLANGGREVLHGVVGGSSLSSLSRKTAFGLRGAVEALPLGRVCALPGKAMRRLDVLSALR